MWSWVSKELSFDAKYIFDFWFCVVEKGDMIDGVIKKMLKGDKVALGADSKTTPPKSFLAKKSHLYPT